TAEAREKSGGAFHLGGTDRAHVFVGQKQLRPRGESSRQFQLLERRSTEPLRGGRAAGKADEVERFLSPPSRLLAVDPAGLAVIGRKHHVIDERELSKRARNLEGACNSPMTDLVGGQAGDVFTAEADQASSRS